MIQEGKLEAFAPTGRVKQRKQVTRRSVLAVMAEQAMFAPSDFLERLWKTAQALPRRDLEALAARVQNRLKHLT